MNLYEVSTLLIGYYMVGITGWWVGRENPPLFSKNWWLACLFFTIGLFFLIITGV